MGASPEGSEGRLLRTDEVKRDSCPRADIIAWEEGRAARQGVPDLGLTFLEGPGHHQGAALLETFPLCQGHCVS